jgi:hypothetical protein
MSTGEKDAALESEAQIQHTEEGETEFRPFDEIAEDFSPSVIMKVIASDGLPTQAVPDGQSVDIPELSPETLVCMGDFSEFHSAPFIVYETFVEEREGVSYLKDSELQVRVEKAHGGVVFLLVDTVFKPEQVERDGVGRWRLKWFTLPDFKGEVYPKREPCHHYVRQVTQFDQNPQAKAHIRLCAARRTTEGTFMTLRDTAMWACSMREPRDLVSEEKYIESFDSEKVEQGKQRVYLSIFGNPKQQ